MRSEPAQLTMPSTPVRFRTGVGDIVGERFEAVGDRRGCVLFLPGSGQRRHSWARSARRAAQVGWDAYAIDARGHGDSDWAPDGDYSIERFADDAFAVAEQLGEVPVVVGASLGGMTALIAEGERGGLARGLVLVDVVARMDDGGIERIHRFMGGSPDGFATLEEAAAAVSAFNPHRPRPASAEGLRRNLVRRADGRWRWHWDPASLPSPDDPRRGADQERAERAAQAVRVPTLLVWGSRSEVVDAVGIDEMRELIPHARTCVVQAGHMVAGDDNDVFSSALDDFLAGIESAPAIEASPSGSRR